MIDTRVEYIKHMGFKYDESIGGRWDKYRRMVGKRVTYITHDTYIDEFIIKRRGINRRTFRNISKHEEYKLFRRKYIINQLLDDRT